MNKAIGVMDSGVGGFTVMKELIRQLPNEKIIYFADEARCPYGEKSQRDVKKYTEQIAEFLTQKDIKLLVLACNTATAASMPGLRDKMDIPVMGVIKPGSRSAIQVTDNQKVIVLSTKGTRDAHAYKNMIERINAEVEVTEFACREFVSLVESGNYQNKKITKETVENTLSPLKKHDADTVILGCTHYPLIRDSISSFFNYEKHIIDSGYETAREVSAYLDFHDMLSDKNSPHEFYINGDYQNFERILNKWIPDLEYSIQSVKL